MNTIGVGACRVLNGEQGLNARAEWPASGTSRSRGSPWLARRVGGIASNGRGRTHEGQIGRREKQQSRHGREEQGPLRCFEVAEAPRIGQRPCHSSHRKEVVEDDRAIDVANGEVEDAGYEAHDREKAHHAYRSPVGGR